MTGVALLTERHAASLSFAIGRGEEHPGHAIQSPSHKGRARLVQMRIFKSFAAPLRLRVNFRLPLSGLAEDAPRGYLYLPLTPNRLPPYPHPLTSL